MLDASHKKARIITLEMKKVLPNDEHFMKNYHFAYSLFQAHKQTPRLSVEKELPNSISYL